MKFHVLALAVAAVVAAPAFAAGDQSATLQIIRTFPADKPAQFAPSTEVVDVTAFYSNVTTFQGTALTNGGAAADPAAPANLITRLICDDTTYNAATGRALSNMQFAVANLDTVPVTTRARVRFYNDNAGVPGAYLTGFSFNALAFPVGVTLFTGNAATPVPIALTGPAVKIWSCITFDNATAAATTAANLNNMGVGLFAPVDRGSSADQMFLTTNQGSFLSANPPGATLTVTGSIASFGVELRDSVSLPVELQSFDVE